MLAVSRCVPVKRRRYLSATALASANRHSSVLRVCCLQTIFGGLQGANWPPQVFHPLVSPEAASLWLGHGMDDPTDDARRTRHPALHPVGSGPSGTRIRWRGGIFKAGSRSAKGLTSGEGPIP